MKLHAKKAVVATFTPDTIYDDLKNACNHFIWPENKYYPLDYSNIDPDNEQ
jgi:hypothetical protein